MFATERTIRRLLPYARKFAADKDGICLVAVHDNQVVGFCAGAVRPKKFFRKMFINRGLLLLFASVFSFFNHPKKIFTALQRAIFFRGETPEELPDESVFLISSLALYPAYSGKGVGSIMLGAMCQFAHQAGMKTAFLTTDAQHNLTVNDFYRRNGFILSSEIKRAGGRVMNRYAREL